MHADVEGTPVPLADSAEGWRKRSAAVTRLARALAQPLDLDEVFGAVREELTNVIGADVVLLALYDDVSQSVQVVRQSERGVEHPGGSFPLGTGLTSQVIRTGTPQLLRRWSLEGPPIRVRYATGTAGLPESAIVVPLQCGGSVLGVLATYAYAAEAFDATDLELVNLVGTQIAPAIARLLSANHIGVRSKQRIGELEAILASMADALVVIDRDRRIVRLNQAARELLGGTEAKFLFGQPLGRPHGEDYPLGGPEVAEVVELMSIMLQNGEIPPEQEVPTIRGGKQVLSFSGTPLRQEHGEIGGGVIVARDVTARREIEQLKDEVLSIASHDLKIPLTVIRAQAQLLMRGLQSDQATPDKLNTGLESIVNQTDHLTRLLALLLDYSRMEAGRLELIPARVNLSELVERTVENVQTTTSRHRIELRGAKNVVVCCDKDRIQEVVENFLSNAIKYSRTGNSIRVRVRRARTSVTVSVSEDGVGLSREDATRVFDRFYRAKGARTLEGAGLGLYICRGIIEAHQGRVRAYSRGLGLGATFSFTIPLQPTE